MDDFIFSLAVSAVLIVVILFSGAGAAIEPLFAIALLALALAGHFAMMAFRKAGLSQSHSEYLFIGTVAGAYLASAIAAGAFQAIVPFAFVPLVFCAPAIGSALRSVIVSG